MQERETTHGHTMVGPSPLAMAILGVPLVVWSAFHAGFFEVGNESIIIPIALFLAAPIMFAAAIWAYRLGEGNLGTALGLFAGFWASYGALLWLQQAGIVAGAEPSTSLRGLLFATWAVAFAIVWLGGLREHWTLVLVTLGATAMFVLLSVGDYAASTMWHQVGGWVGIATAIVAWYSALAEMVEAEFGRALLPVGGRMRLRLRTR